MTYLDISNFPLEVSNKPIEYINIKFVLMDHGIDP